MSEQALDQWIGSTERMADTLDPVHAARIAATLGVAAPAAGEPLPPLWQWAYFIRTATWPDWAVTVIRRAAGFCLRPMTATVCGRAGAWISIIR